MSEYEDFFFGAKASIVELECLEISHSSFSKVYYIVRNATKGVTVTHEDDTEHEYEYYPLGLSLSGVRDDLDHILNVTLGDLGLLIPSELKLVKQAGTSSEKPICKYRTYRSDNLTVPMKGPYLFQIPNVNMKSEGAAFEAKAPNLNISKTGENYDLSRFPTQRGML